MYIARVVLTSLVILALLATPGLAGDKLEDHLKLGRQYLQDEQYENAIAELMKADAVAPGRSIAVLTSLSKAYEKTDEPAAAIESCRKFIAAAQLDERLARAHNLLGVWLLRQADENPGHLEEAEKAFRTSLELSAGKAHRVRLNLAEVLHRMGREADAFAVLEDYPRTEPDDIWRSQLLGPISDPVFDRLTEVLLAQGPETPVYFQGSVEKPEKINAPPPVYTQYAQDLRIEGIVKVRTVIDRNGHVADVKVLEGLPYGLSEEVVEVISEWEFEPARFRGEPVAVYYNMTVNFRLDEEKETT